MCDDGGASIPPCSLPPSSCSYACSSCSFEPRKSKSKDHNQSPPGWPFTPAPSPRILSPRVTETKKTRVVVGMSGGVDSSAAAALLLGQGYDVVGITLKLWPQDCVSRAEDKCCGPQAVTDARAVCHRLGIPYSLIDEAAAIQ